MDEWMDGWMDVWMDITCISRSTRLRQRLQTSEAAIYIRLDYGDAVYVGLHSFPD